ncbi:MAG: hypothetical protein ACR2IH_00590 [Pyrinomonadaceae bacterium]
MAVNHLPDPRAATRRFFALVAIAFPLVIIAGFGPTYYLRPFFDAPPIPSMLVHFHGFLMTLWIALFIVQVYFISSRRIKLHQKLGIFGVILGLLIIPTGLLTAVAAAKYGSPSTPAGFDPHAFMAVPFFDMVVFAPLLAGIVYYRKQPANHKRLVLISVLNFVPPALGRIQIGWAQTLGPVFFLGLPDLIAIIFVIVDTWRHKKLNKVFLAATILLIVSHPIRILVSGTETWLAFANWITS